MNAISPRVSSTGKPWVDCPKCAGTGLVSGISKAGREFRDRPCFRCAGTGDGNIVMPFRRSGRGGAAWLVAGQPAPAGTPVPLSADDDDEQDDDDEGGLVLASIPLPDDDDDDVAEAARKLAAAIAARRTKAAPIDEAAVRRIAEEVVTAATLPRRLDIIVNGTFTGTLPAVRHPAMEELIDCLAAGEHVALIGPSGSGKTKGAELAFEALRRPFRLQPSIGDIAELTGYRDGHGVYHTTPTREAVQHGGGLLFDEFDGSIDANAPLKLNAILANGYASFPDSAEPIPVHPDFCCVATANTWHGANGKYMGRTQLDQATLDRFHFIPWGYDNALEAALCPNAEWLTFVQSARDAVTRLGIETVISTRAAIRGAKQIARGMNREAVERGNIWRGLAAEDVARIRSAMRGA